ncbi:MAG: L-threonylcarbamoyladenylate synthase [Candidatus Micrarchaeota archaeon]|nr:L-threonylcarbamoyladenylate synthase [Candidatus Micrarchaeota archaeon]
MDYNFRRKQSVGAENKIKNVFDEEMTKIETKIVDPRKMHAFEYRKFISEIAEMINNGEVIVFPTETVYGLGANAFDSKAVLKIFRIKNRPRDNPIIVHISSKNMLKNLAREINKDAEKLAERFWPGPLTMILKKNFIVPEITTSELDTIAIRMPNNKIALDIIKESNVPIAAPSANISGRPSATTAKDAYSDLKGLVPIIIDGGQCKIGIESTVINMTSEPYTILREGYITKEEIEECLKKTTKKCEANECDKPLSPGMKYKHYSPNAKVLLARRKEGRIKTLINIAYEAEKLASEKKRIEIIFSEPIPEKMRKEFEKFAKVVEFRNNIEMAHSLFKALREADKKKIDIIIIEGVVEVGLGCAIMERIEKAADAEIILPFHE